ncbi:MAG: glycosyltransferase family 4 protein [Bdellovibrionales bacterium]|nr:glycosyltransferase family 4 protein [Bdellovibrionales bacterium]
MQHNKIVFSHPLGNPFATNALRAINNFDILESAFCAWAYTRPITNSAWIPQTVSSKLHRELTRRAWLPSLNRPVRMSPYREFARMFLSQTHLDSALGISRQSLVDWVYEGIDSRVARYIDSDRDLAAVYAYEDAALNSFRAAKQNGQVCFYDLPIAYYETAAAIAKHEAALFPELTSSLLNNMDSKQKLERKRIEAQLADYIVVASTFTCNSLISSGIPRNKISLIPYGISATDFSPAPTPPKTLNILFVGRVGPRKGVHYLLKSFNSLGIIDAKLKLIGTNEFPRGWLEKNLGSAQYQPTIAHHSLIHEYQNASVLVLPSLIEGFGMVILEAMACGIPVIATPNTAATDIIDDGVDGFVIPIRNIDALKEKILWCYDNPDQLTQMGKLARLKACHFSWERYRSSLGSFLLDKLNLKDSDNASITAL